MLFFIPTMTTILFKKSGFTLIEIMITLIIVGLLSALVIPRFAGTIEKNKVSEAFSILSAVRQAQVVYEFETGNYSTTINNLDVTIPASDNYDTLFVDDVSSDRLIASVDSRSPTFDYTIGILLAGTICCTSNAPATACETIGYTTACP